VTLPPSGVSEWSAPATTRASSTSCASGAPPDRSGADHRCTGSPLTLHRYRSEVAPRVIPVLNAPRRRLQIVAEKLPTLPLTAPMAHAELYALVRDGRPVAARERIGFYV